MRLGRLGRVCDVEMRASMVREDDAAPVREWLVRITPLEGPRRAPIEVRAGSAAAAMEEAVTRAEAFGWPDALPLSNLADGQAAS
jgi:hypothetical protein